MLKKNDDSYTSLDDLWEERDSGFGDKHLRGPASIGIDVVFFDAAAIYGIPEHGDSLALQDTFNAEPYRLYNLDVFEYELNERMALYGAVPFI